MTEQTNTPELRFSNFLDIWHIHKLSDVATITGGGTPSTKVSEYWNGAIDWYTPNEIGERIYAKGSKKKITNLGYKKSSTKLLPVNTILFTSRAGIGNTAILAKEGCTNQGFQSIIPNSEKIDSYFIYTISNHIKKYALKHAAGSTFLEISGKELGKMKLFLPTLKEQQKIGVFFSKLDRQIELEEQKLAKLEEQKKGYIQQIFSQELRFKDEDGNDYTEWKTKKLDELGEFNSGVGFPEKYQGGNTGFPFFKVSDMNLLGNEKFMNTANNYVSIEQIKQKKWKVIQNVPAIIFAKVGAAIMLNRKRMVLNPFLIDNNTMSYSFSNHWDTNFGYVVFQTLNLPKYAQVGALPSYNSKDIGIVQIRLPIKEEQEKIGDFFSKLDENINKQSQKIDGLKLRKQGFLQKMFV
ncbi:restriction endonuclease subunit S [Staphylococcus carnosus]|uniref:Restriction endonuclease subunit S n=1 Tax=Staphylococcus carnosus TaxID=1281 RepID=A0AAJ0NHF6_STACA|nr:restriction endonuclease subunit S [Staphylococcus carnosus]KKB25559.1 restriction endonuclease subunit S [Staphylococcus carnosus]QQS86349.1 restriction endonuclease subunit S [Staphylococcus carnosus]UTB83988.1 restriction endonuclease subunit S [Staphylococcus carnosus]UTB99362.1 restriction endonuclease subunit S [Staphylococcus carnosus]UTC03845.1 restriction endonuclease subunit S [Staphylococcus carnosus]